MTFLTTLMTRLHSRFAQVKAQGDSGQDLIEYSVITGGLIFVGAVVYLVVSH